MPSLLTRSDWYANGQWDASHAQDPGSVREYWGAHGRPTDASALIRAWWESESDGDARDSWIDANYIPSESAIGPEDAYTAWSEGWIAYATRATASDLPEWEAQYQDHMRDLADLVVWQRENGIAPQTRDLARIEEWLASQRNS